jgi:serine/threonine-protein kinase
MEGFGTSVEPFNKMAQAYKNDNGMEPNIGVHQVDQRQCAIVDFLQNIRSMAKNDPALALSRDVLKVGDVLSGTISKVGNREVYLYLVTNEGVVYSLDALWKQRKTTGDSSVFGMKLFPTTDDPMPKPHPHLIFAIASSKPINSAKISDPVLASALFPVISNEIKSSGDEVGAAVGYFMFGG